MSSIRISQLTAVSSTDDNDFLVINDQDNETRKISFLNFKDGFLVSASPTSQYVQGGLAIGGTQAVPEIELTAAGNVRADGYFRSTQQTSTDIGYETYLQSGKTFQVLSDGNLQIGGTIGAAGDMTANVEIESDGTIHTDGMLMVHGELPSDVAVQAMQGSTINSQLLADGSFRAGGDINVGGVPQIALTPGGGIAIAGSYGASGQVLTSGGAGASLTWTTPAVATKGDKGQKGDDGQKGDTGATGTAGQKGAKGVPSPLLTFKGTTPTTTTLNAITGMAVGDVYLVEADQDYYAWDGAQWDEIAAPSKGEKGINGTKGEKGDDGAQGTKGQKGDDGATGAQGVKGNTGAGTKGQKGAVGPAADKGEKGEKGEDGTAGAKGATGGGGDKGQKGDASGVFEFKGSVPDLTALNNVQNPATGDVYRVTADNKLYAWNGSAWVELGAAATLKGEKGQKGQGEKGQKGEGDKGDTGTNGVKGVKGEKGSSGADDAAGASDQIQFNSSGSLGANSNFTVNPTTGSLYCKQINASGTGVNQIGINTGGASMYLYTDSNFIGNTGSTLNLFSTISSNVIPSQNNNFALGSNSKFWNHTYTKQVDLGTEVHQRILPLYSAGSANDLRGLAVGGIDLHSGSAGSRCVYLGNGAGGTVDGGEANQTDVVVVGGSSAESGIGKRSTVLGANSARYLNNTCQDNIIIGYLSGCNLGGSSTVDLTTSVMVGSQCGEYLSSGEHNVWIGYDIGGITEVSTGNTYINTGNAPTTGGGNVIVGGYDQNGIVQPVHVFSGAGPDNNNVLIGSSKTANAYVKVAWTVTSDERDKMIYGPCPHGLDFVTGLRPLAYQFKKDGRHSEMGDGKLRYGFSAQDIAELEGEQKVVIDDSYADCLKYTSDHMIPILVNAIQELKREVDSLRNHTH